MSSIASAPPSPDEKRATFLRSRSLQRLKCSATLQFQLAGSRLTKAALTKLFERVILKARTLLQRALLLCSLPALKLISTVVLCSIHAFAKSIGINLVFEKRFEKLIGNESVVVRIKRLPVAAGQIDSEVADETTTDLNASETLAEDCAREQAAIAEADLLSSDKYTSPNKHNFCLAISFYGSAALICIQLMGLMVALNVWHSPPGLIFLVLSLGFIGYVIYKVLLIAKPKTNETIVAKSVGNARFRISRASSQRYLIIHNKALSRVKLL